MSAVTIWFCSPRKWSLSLFPLFPPPFATRWWEFSLWHTLEWLPPLLFCCNCFGWNHQEASQTDFKDWFSVLVFNDYLTAFHGIFSNKQGPGSLKSSKRKNCLMGDPSSSLSFLCCPWDACPWGPRCSTAPAPSPSSLHIQMGTQGVSYGISRYSQFRRKTLKISQHSWNMLKIAEVKTQESQSPANKPRQNPSSQHLGPEAWLVHSQLGVPRILILKGMVCGPLAAHQGLLWMPVISLILRN